MVYVAICIDGLLMKYYLIYGIKNKRKQAIVLYLIYIAYNFSKIKLKC